MTEKEKLQAYEKMQAFVQAAYDSDAAKLEALRRQEKQKTATYRQLLGEKLYYANILSLYDFYHLTQNSTQQEGTNHV